MKIVNTVKILGIKAGYCHDLSHKILTQLHHKNTNISKHY